MKEEKYNEWKWSYRKASQVKVQCVGWIFIILLRVQWHLKSFTWQLNVFDWAQCPIYAQIDKTVNDHTLAYKRWSAFLFMTCVNAGNDPPYFGWLLAFTLAFAFFLFCFICTAIFFSIPLCHPLHLAWFFAFKQMHSSAHISAVLHIQMGHSLFIE